MQLRQRASPTICLNVFALREPQNPAGQRCDDTLRGIFGGDGTVFATDRDPYGIGNDEGELPMTTSFFGPQNPSQSQTPCERKLAGIFGGLGAIMRTRYDSDGQYRGRNPELAARVAANTAQMGTSVFDAEHLYNFPHLSGNLAGTTNTDIYVPGNYQGQPTRPSPTAGVVLINYAQLGDLSNVTLAIYHVGNFGVQRMPDGRVRIGTTGGPGGSDAGNFHSHFEIWNGRQRDVVDGAE